MGKKSKVGKRRRDKFYHLAKETGYRSRSAFKLIQLNRKFNFLQRSRVLIDLCAAPGGWLQVASKFMPMSSLIIGVDLVAIKAIPNVLCLQGDITTDKCRQGLARELKTWKVDCVLHDGAPNVGTNWEYDAFSQARLTLAALKLAANFLINGGCFLTKVFRSRDYQALMWIFQQLFKKVQATKPQASRNESAEIFVVCQGFLAADKIDSKFFDPKFAFKEVEEEVKSANNVARNKKPKAEGYTEGDYTQFHSFSVMDFVKGRNPTEFLRRCSEIKLDNADMVEHPSTTDELRECCRDVRVLGRKELRSLVVWRQKLRHFLAAKLKQEAAVFDDQTSSELLEQQQNREEQEQEEEEEEDIEKQIAELKEQEVLQLKRKKKTILKERRKLRARMELKMDLPGNSIDTSGETSLFNLMSVTKSKMGELDQGNMTLVEEEDFEEEYEDGLGFDEDEISLASDLDPDDMKEVEEREQRMKQNNLSDGTESHDGQEEEENPLLVDYEDRTTKVQRETDLWFAKDIFSGVGNEKDDAVEIQLTKDVYSKKINNEKDGKTHVAEVVSGATAPKGGVVPAVDSGLDSEGTDDERERLTEAVRVVKGYKRDWENAELQLAPAEKHSVKKVRILDAEGLALGTVIATSRRRTRDLINNSFNRFVNGGEEDLPAWFSADERKNWRKAPEVERAAVTSYSNKWKEVNTRSIKKVAEAKARKKKKLVKRMEKARKKAEVVSDIVDISEKEKVAQIKSIYKKAGVVKKKREVSYVVAKKGLGGQSGRPRGVKGHYRMVDRRLKKDIRAKMSKRKGKGPAKSQDKGRHGSGKNRSKR